eukprot:TRINITY_DN14895_c0_g1_i2.p1 TRINITY_DN14895_c0_g1~~TRINITY_DN14895_c0_g1_i2.p1  ORF type:complete len:191 (+),score=-4.24 TRINITY_DN14895_c0_g1_i2:285-857(+)
MIQVFLGCIKIIAKEQVSCFKYFEKKLLEIENKSIFSDFRVFTMNKWTFTPLNAYNYEQAKRKEKPVKFEEFFPEQIQGSQLDRRQKRYHIFIGILTVTNCKIKQLTFKQQHFSQIYPQIIIQQTNIIQTIGIIMELVQVYIQKNKITIKQLVCINNSYLPGKIISRIFQRKKKQLFLDLTRTQMLLQLQ